MLRHLQLRNDHKLSMQEIPLKDRIAILKEKHTDGDHCELTFDSLAFLYSQRAVSESHTCWFRSSKAMTAIVWLLLPELIVQPMRRVFAPVSFYRQTPNIYISYSTQSSFLDQLSERWQSYIVHVHLLCQYSISSATSASTEAIFFRQTLIPGGLRHIVCRTRTTVILKVMRWSYSAAL